MNLIENAQVIEADLQWLGTIIEHRIQNFINRAQTDAPVLDTNPPAPEISGVDSGYLSFIQKYGLSPDERKVALLALAPQVQPELLDRFLIRNDQSNRIYTEFGGFTTQAFNGFIPTVKTALFILGGHSIGEQVKYAGLFDKTSKLYAANILKECKSEEAIPPSSRPLALSESALSYIFTGEDIQYQYSADFPARQLTTLMEWENLVLPETTLLNLQELLAWPVYGQKLIDELQMAKNIQPGYRALFHGPPGTGKTLTAALIGKKVNKPVYRIDLAQLVSKYIGEAEKNLEKIFKVAETRDWILFFDKADALFGKRTGVSSPNDRFANQETGYLLQQVESCNNIVILAINLIANVDEAFTRRFESIIYFPLPGEAERLRLWQGAFSNNLSVDPAINLEEIANKYDITGGSIVNVVRYTTLMAVARGATSITYNDLMDGIRREYAKLGRTF